MSDYKSDVMKLAQTYKAQGATMSEAMKRAYSEIDKSQYQTADSAQTAASKLGESWEKSSEALKTVESESKGLKSVFDLLANAATNVGSKSKTAATQHKVLSAELKQAKANVRDLQNQYNAAAKETGTTSQKTKELQQKLKEAQAEVNSLKSELKEYPSLLGRVASGFSKFGSAAAKVGSVAGKGITALVGGIGAATTAAGAAVTALGAIGLNYNSQMESYTTNFEVMLGSQEAAAQKVEELKTMAAKTPFEMSDLAKGTQTLLAFNVASEDTTGVLTSLGDISLGDSQKLESLTRAYGKMNAAQKVTLEDINMMIDAGYNPLLNIQEKTGESMSALYDRISAGEVSFSEIQEAIAAATSEGGQFYQGMEKASQTTQGLISTLKDNAQALVGQVFQPISASLTSTLLPTAISAIDQLSAAFESGGVTGMMNAASSIIAGVLGQFSSALPSFITTAMQIVQTLGNGIMQNLPTITQSAFNAFMAFADGLAQMLPGLANSAFAIISMLAQNLLNNLPQIVQTAVEIFTGFIDTFIEWLPQLIPLAFQIVTQLGTALVENIPTLIDSVLQLGAAVVQGIIDGIASAWDGLVSWFTGLWDSLFSNRSVNVNVNKTTSSDGSHAIGLDYVPYNRYMAELHRGEMVLTRTEAESYRAGQSQNGGNGVVVQQTIYAAKQTPVELAAATKAYFQRARWALA